MVDVLTEIDIAAPSEKVSEYAANPDHAPAWYENIDSAQWQTQPPLTMGSRILFRANFPGRQLEYIYEIVEFRPGRKLVMRTANGPFPMETTYTWDSTGDNVTRMTLRNRGNPTGFAKWVTPFMSVMMKRANMKDLKKLKDILERHP